MNGNNSYGSRMLVVFFVGMLVLLFVVMSAQHGGSMPFGIVDIINAIAGM